MGAVVGVVAVHVGDVLEVVGVQRAVLHAVVGGVVVVDGLNLQGDALLGQHVHHLLQDLHVGGGGGAHADGDVRRGGGGLGAGVAVNGSLGVAAGGLVVGAAAGQQGQADRAGQRQGKDLLFHNAILLHQKIGMTSCIVNHAFVGFTNRMGTRASKKQKRP